MEGGSTLIMINSECFGADLSYKPDRNKSEPLEEPGVLDT